jgi:uncharacterized protein YukE
VPPDDGYQTDIRKMREDVARWCTHADTTAGTASTAAGLGLDSMTFSYPGIWAGLADSYQRLQQQLADWLRQGGETMDGIADALARTADTYELAERASAAASDALRGLVSGHP